LLGRKKKSYQKEYLERKVALECNVKLKETLWCKPLSFACFFIPMK
jgi:hypothetical protein